jgi:hypothetical protein
MDRAVLWTISAPPHNYFTDTEMSGGAQTDTHRITASVHGQVSNLLVLMAPPRRHIEVHSREVVKLRKVAWWGHLFDGIGYERNQLHLTPSRAI